MKLLDQVCHGILKVDLSNFSGFKRTKNWKAADCVKQGLLPLIPQANTYRKRGFTFFRGWDRQAPTMPLHGQLKQEVISRYKLHDQDTGSPEVQIALISTRISDLTKHFEANKKDHGSRLGLLKLVGQRRRLLAHLKNKDEKRYAKLIGDLGIRK